MTLPATIRPPGSASQAHSGDELPHWPPVRLAVLFVAAQVLLWTAVPALTHHALPLDVVEGLVWGHEWQWGYWKHPPLPSWLLAATDAGFAAPFLLSQVFVAGTYAAGWLLARDVLGARAATLALLLQSGVLYFTFLSPEFNHNVAQMPLWGLAILALWRARNGGSLRWWLVLGLALGLGGLTKYSIAVLAATMLLYALTGRATRHLLASPGPWLATAVAALLVLPHLSWLAANDFLPLTYARDRAAADPGLWPRLGEGLGFLGAQVLNHLPLLLLLAVAGLVVRRRQPDGPADAPARGLHAETRRFLLWMGLGPALLTAAAAGLAGAGLRDMWGAPMFSISGLLALVLLRHRLPVLQARRLVVAAFGLLLLGALSYGVMVAGGPALTGEHKRANWPARSIAGDLARAWTEATRQPLRIVVGDVWLAGIVAVHAPGGDRPSVLINGDRRIAPWVSESDLVRQGALVVWRHDRERDRLASRFPALQPQPPLSVPWPDRRGEPLRIGWGVVPPAAAAQR